MGYKFFSKNGQVLPIEQAAVPLENIAYAYGFGAYENIRLDKGIIYFADDHLERLQESARIIGVEHEFSSTFIHRAVSALIAANDVQTCNLKLLLIGGQMPAQTQLYILCLNPLFPDRKLYRTGTELITYQAERPFPHAKTLNMLQSYIAYREAKKQNAYDALLINTDGNLTEGTRTNFFVMRGKTLISPPEDKILLGVMRKAVLQVAEANNYELLFEAIGRDSLNQYDTAFLTSTSSKIMPIRSIDSHIFSGISQELRELMNMCDEFLASCGGKL